MLFETFVLGQLQNNCYVLSNKPGHAVIIDPAENGDKFADYLAQKQLQPDAVFLTHSHFDHIGGLTSLVSRTGAPVYLHRDEYAIVPVLSQGRLKVETRDYPEIMDAAGLSFRIYHTPGHSPGSVCIRTEDLLFTGDTLFFGSCGRIDFPGGSWEQMASSLRLLATLDGEISVFPGHGESSRIDTERKYNPYLRKAMEA